MKKWVRQELKVKTNRAWMAGQKDCSRCQREPDYIEQPRNLFPVPELSLY